MSLSTVPSVADFPAAPSTASRTSHLRAVEIAFCALIFTLPLETVLYYQTNANDPTSSISIARGAGILLMALALADWRRSFREIPRSFWLVACYMGVFILSQLTIPSVTFPEFREREYTLIQMLGLFLVSYNLLRKPDFRHKALAFYGWLMALAALGMITGVFGVDVQANTEDRYALLAQDPNLTAAMFGMGILCLLGHPRLIEKGRKWSRVLLTGAACSVLVFAILRTGSRGGLMALAAGLLAFAVVPGKGTRGARIALLLAALTVSGGLVAREFALGTSTAERLTRAWQDDDTAGRIEIFDTAWAMFHERPLLGWGGGANRFFLGTRLNFPDRDTHNLMLGVLTEVGLIGGLPFLLALLDITRRSWQAGRLHADVMLFPLVCCLLVMCNSVTGIQEKIFWIVLGAAAAGGP